MSMQLTKSTRNRNPINVSVGSQRHPEICNQIIATVSNLQYSPFPVGINYPGISSSPMKMVQNSRFSGQMHHFLNQGDLTDNLQVPVTPSQDWMRTQYLLSIINNQAQQLKATNPEYNAPFPISRANPMCTGLMDTNPLSTSINGTSQDYYMKHLIPQLQRRPVMWNPLFQNTTYDNIVDYQPPTLSTSNGTFRRREPSATFIPSHYSPKTTPGNFYSMDEEPNSPQWSDTEDNRQYFPKKSKLLVSLSDYTDESIIYDENTDADHCSISSESSLYSQAMHLHGEIHKKRRRKKRRMDFSERKILKVIKKFAKLPETRRLLKNLTARKCKKKRKTKDQIYRAPYYISKMFFPLKSQPLRCAGHPTAFRDMVPWSQILLRTIIERNSKYKTVVAIQKGEAKDKNPSQRNIKKKKLKKCKTSGSIPQSCCRSKQHNCRGKNHKCARYKGSQLIQKKTHTKISLSKGVCAKFRRLGCRHYRFSIYSQRNASVIQQRKLKIRTHRHSHRYQDLFPRSSEGTAIKIQQRDDLSRMKLLHENIDNNQMFTDSEIRREEILAKDILHYSSPDHGHTEKRSFLGDQDEVSDSMKKKDYESTNNVLKRNPEVATLVTDEIGIRNAVLQDMINSNDTHSPPQEHTSVEVEEVSNHMNSFHSESSNYHLPSIELMENAKDMGDTARGHRENLVTSNTTGDFMLKRKPPTKIHSSSPATFMKPLNKSRVDARLQLPDGTKFKVVGYVPAKGKSVNLNHSSLKYSGKLSSQTSSETPVVGYVPAKGNSVNLKHCSLKSSGKLSSQSASETAVVKRKTANYSLAVKSSMVKKEEDGSGRKKWIPIQDGKDQKSTEKRRKVYKFSYLNTFKESLDDKKWSIESKAKISGEQITDEDKLATDTEDLEVRCFNNKYE